jgi:hypothetical protein
MNSINYKVSHDTTFFSLLLLHLSLVKYYSQHPALEKPQSALSLTARDKVSRPYKTITV